MSALKLQLNSVEILEKLIGGDSDVEVELRNSIVQEFTKKHLKSIANVQVNKLEFLVRQEIDEIAKEKFGKKTYDTWGHRYVLELNSEIKTAVTNILQEESKKLINEVVKEYLSHLNLEALIKTVVDRQITVKIAEQVKAQVNDKMRDIMKAVNV